MFLGDVKLASVSHLQNDHFSHESTCMLSFSRLPPFLKILETDAFIAFDVPTTVSPK